MPITATSRPPANKNVVICCKNRLILPVYIKKLYPTKEYSFGNFYSDGNHIIL